MRRVSDEAHRPFDLERGPVSRATLFTASPEDHVLLVSAHHIGADGWSNWIPRHDRRVHARRVARIRPHAETATA
jgi:Condensation domain